MTQQFNNDNNLLPVSDSEGPLQNTARSVSPLIAEGLSPIICGMSAIGKSYLANGFGDLFVDLESSQYQWQTNPDRSYTLNEEGKKVQKDNWVKDYIDAALSVTREGKIPLLSFQPAVFEELRDRGLQFDIVIHNQETKDAVVNRLRERSGDQLNLKTGHHTVEANNAIANVHEKLWDSVFYKNIEDKGAVNVFEIAVGIDGQPQNVSELFNIENDRLGIPDADLKIAKERGLEGTRRLRESQRNSESI